MPVVESSKKAPARSHIPFRRFHFRSKVNRAICVSQVGDFLNTLKIVFFLELVLQSRKQIPVSCSDYWNTLSRKVLRGFLGN